jgi:hypothetical protein
MGFMKKLVFAAAVGGATGASATVVVGGASTIAPVAAVGAAGVTLAATEAADKNSSAGHIPHSRPSNLQASLEILETAPSSAQQKGEIFATGQVRQVSRPQDEKIHKILNGYEDLRETLKAQGINLVDPEKAAEQGALEYAFINSRKTSPATVRTA